MTKGMFALLAGGVAAAAVIAAGAIYAVKSGVSSPKPPAVTASLAASPAASVVAASPPAAALPSPTVAPAATASLAATLDAAASATPALPETPKPSAAPPSFDVVRVEPGGDTVVAGHGPPKGSVELRVDGVAVDKAVANPAGEFVFVPPPLAPGSHRLELAALDKGPAALSTPLSVTVKPTAVETPRAAPSTPAAAPAPKPSPSATPTKAAVAVPAPTPAASPASPAKPVAQVFIRSVDAAEAGGLGVKGSGEPGRTVRLYLNGTFIADVVAGADGQWSLTISHGVSPGNYVVRADEIGGADGAVSSRAEVPFTSVAPVAAATPAPAPAPAVAAAAPAPEPSVAAAVEAPTPAPQPSSPSAAPTPVVATPTFALALEPAAASAAVEATPSAAPAAAPSPTASASMVPAAAPVPVSLPTPTPSGDSSNVVIDRIGTATVVPGDSLWRIGEKVYGDGMRYHGIYAANQNQIRNPDLIYPGQVFVLPVEPKP